MNYKRLGDYIHKVNRRNHNLQFTKLLGVSISKKFMPSVANQSDLDLSNYKIISKGQFAANLMHVNRDKVIPVALYNHNEPALVSTAYVTFEIIDETKLLPEFLMMEFLRPEFDRKAWLFCDSSVRGSLEWERLCEMKIPDISLAEQHKYTVPYKSLLSNQLSFESSLADLQLICDTYIEDLMKKEPLKSLGKYISEVDERNRNLHIYTLKGVSASKNMVEKKTAVGSNRFSNYKVVKTGDFVYVPDTSRRGDKVALAINSAEPCIVPTRYTVFRVIRPEKLLPQYLYLFFLRPEFDRYARFNSWGSVRETFNWDDLCQVQLPIPNVKIQEAIVSIFDILETRKHINRQLNEHLQPLCQVLMRGVANGVCI